MNGDHRVGLGEQCHLPDRWRQSHLSGSGVIIRWGWDNRVRLGVSAMCKSGLNQCRKLPQVLAWILLPSLGRGLVPENNATVKGSMFACTCTVHPVPRAAQGEEGSEPTHYCYNLSCLQDEHQCQAQLLVLSHPFPLLNLTFFLSLGTGMSCLANSQQVRSEPHVCEGPA